LYSSIRYVESVIDGSIPFAASGLIQSATSLASHNFRETIALIGSQRHDITDILAISSSYDNSDTQDSSLVYAASKSLESRDLIDSTRVERSVNFGISTGLIRTLKFTVSFVYDYSGPEIWTERFDETEIVNITGSLLGTGNVLFIASKVFVVTDALMTSSIFDGRTRFYANGDIAGSRNHQDSIQFAGTEHFIEANGGKDGSGTDKLNGKVSMIVAIVCSLALLLLIVLGVIFLMRRNRKDQLTDVALGYETETEANVIDFHENEFGTDQVEDWNIHGFETAIESEFAGGSQIDGTFNEEIFQPVGDELF
jgi:hypothetical protein